MPHKIDIHPEDTFAPVECVRHTEYATLMLQQRIDQLTNALQRLLNTTELNLDEREPETLEAIAQAEVALFPKAA